MNGFLAKLKTIFKSAREANANAAVITVPSSETPLNPSNVDKRNWILGNLSVAMAILLLLLLAFNLKQTRDIATQIELTMRLQAHNQRLPVVLQQVFAGRENAFKQLGDIRDAIDRSLTVLAQGGHIRQHHITPVHASLQPDYLDTIVHNWQIEAEKIQLVLNSHHAFVNLGRAVSIINTTGTQINDNLEQLIAYMAEIGSSPDQLGVVSTMGTLSQNVFRSINVVLASKLPVTEIQNQLTHDRKQFSAIVSALNEGHDVLKLSAIEDSVAQAKLEQIKSMFAAIDEHILTIQNEIAAVMPAKVAANQLIQNNETMYNSIAVLDDALQVHDGDTTDLMHTVTYVLLTCTLICAGWFLYAQYRRRRQQPQSTGNGLDQTQQAMLRLLDDMKKMAEGDLTVRTEVTEDITGAIADAVNFTIEELHTLVEQVNRASVNVATASHQAQQVSATLLDAARRQSQKIEQTTLAMVGMAEAIDKVSDNAEASTHVAQQSLTTAEKGSIAVRQAIAGMDDIRTHIQDTAKRIKRLGESAQEINEIVALVSDITEQTNVLALNAALQASSAGEAGRGFNMIAQEVQRLAERSAAAGKQIGRLIKMIQDDTYDAIAAMERSTFGVAQGTQRSHAAGKALEEIETVSTQLAEHVAQIYETTHAQTQAANTVIENMEDILQITRQTTDGSQETTTAIRQITGYAAQLKSSVSNFKV